METPYTSYVNSIPPLASIAGEDSPLCPETKAARANAREGGRYANRVATVADSATRIQALAPVAPGASFATLCNMSGNRLVAGLGVLLGCAGCGGIGEPPAPIPCTGSDCAGGEADVTFSYYNGSRSIDLLLVIDDRIPTSAFAPTLERELRGVAQTMQLGLDYGRFVADYNVAMIPASWVADAAVSGDGSNLWPVDPPCVQLSGPYFHAGRLCESPSNFQGAIGDTLACAALHLTSSGQASRPFDTVRAVLGPGGPAEQSGLRRKNATLYVIVVASEDDPTLASASAREEYAAFLRELVERPDDQLLVGVVAPASAENLVGLVTQLGLPGVFDDLAAQYWRAFAYFDGVETNKSSNFCLDWPIADADPTIAGLQPNCVVVEGDVLANATVAERITPTCPADGSSSEICWRLTADRTKCPMTGQLVSIGWPSGMCLPNYQIKFTAFCAIQIEKASPGP